MRRVVSVLLWVLMFFVAYFDDLYELRSLEWVPDIVQPVLGVTALYNWNPEWWKRPPGSDSRDNRARLPEA